MTVVPNWQMSRTLAPGRHWVAMPSRVRLTILEASWYLVQTSLAFPGLSGWEGERRGEGGKGGREREREKYVRDEDGCKRGREMEMGATFKGAVTRVVALAAQLPRGEPFSRKGRVGEDKPPHVPMVHGPQRPRQDRRPSATSPAATAPTRRTPHAPVGHVRDLLLLLPSGHDALFLVAHCGWSVGWSFGFCLLGLGGVRSILSGDQFLRFVALPINLPGRPHDFGGGGGGGMHHTMPLVRSTCTYLPYVPCGTHTYLHTTS